MGEGSLIGWAWRIGIFRWKLLNLLCWSSRSVVRKWLDLPKVGSQTTWDIVMGSRDVQLHIPRDDLDLTNESLLRFLHICQWSEEIFITQLVAFLHAYNGKFYVRIKQGNLSACFNNEPLYWRSNCCSLVIPCLQFLKKRATYVTTGNFVVNGSYKNYSYENTHALLTLM